MSVFPLWWSAVKADAELAGEPLTDDQLVLHFSGSGMSVQVTARQLDQYLQRTADLEQALTAARDKFRRQLWGQTLYDGHPMVRLLEQIDQALGDSPLEKDG